jgi:excisionase family DNA binding protein
MLERGVKQMERQSKGKRQGRQVSGERALAEQATNSLSQPLLLTIPEVAFALGLGRTKVYELIANEGLPFVKFGMARRVSVISLRKWIEQREEQCMSA